MGEITKLTEQENKEFKSLERRLLRFFDKYDFVKCGLTMSGTYNKRKYKLLIAHADLESENCTCFFNDNEDIKYHEETDSLSCEVCGLPIPSVSLKDIQNNQQ